MKSHNIFLRIFYNRSESFFQYNIEKIILIVTYSRVFVSSYMYIGTICFMQVYIGNLLNIVFNKLATVYYCTIERVMKYSISCNTDKLI